MFDKIKKYLQDSWAETKKVQWLTKEDTKKLTIEVILFSLTFVVIYGLIDALLARGVIFLTQ